MPFLEHFGLRDYPFGLTPNPRMFYPAESAQAMLAGLEFSLMRGDGLMKVVGAVGSGKTLLCRLLLERLQTLSVNTAYLNAPGVIPAAQLPTYIVREFGLDLSPTDDAAIVLRDYLLKQHAAGKRNILIVDEAQGLGADGLEAIRLLSNLETDTHKLLQIVLFGQTELDQLLRRQELRQLAQRLSFSFATQPLDVEGTADYVRFRVERCQLPEARRLHFTLGALRRLARVSGGLPRVIHLLADKALFAAYAEGVTIIEPRHIRAAQREMLGAGWYWRPWHWAKAA